MRQRSLPTRRPQDRGASAIEYAGLIVLAALILGALVAIGIPGNVGTGVERAICTILHEQNCGKPPAAASPRSPGKTPGNTTPTGAVPRFAGGVLHGLASIVVPPAGERSSLPIRAASLPTQQQPAKPRRKGGGGDKTSGHNAVVRDAERLINQTKGQYVTDGKVTIDCMPGGTKANCIPGGHKSGNGKNGRADVILRGYDKNTGRPVIYIWEIKSDSPQGRVAAKAQLDRYVRLTQAQVGRSTEVRYGYDLEDTYPILDKRGRKLEAYSRGAADPNVQGVRLYRDPATSSPTPSQQATPQQTQSQPQQRPSSLVCNEQPPIALKAKKECINIPGLPQGGPRGAPRQQPQQRPQAPPEPEAPAPAPVPEEPAPVEPLVPVGG